MRERAAEEHRRLAAGAWYAGVCVGAAWAGKLPPFRKWLDDVAPEPGDSPAEREAREKAELRARERALSVELLFESGRAKRMAANAPQGAPPA